MEGFSWFMTGRHFSRQAYEDPRKLFSTWLNGLQVKWWWNSQAVNFLNRSRCLECDRVEVGHLSRMLGVACLGCMMSCVCCAKFHVHNICLGAAMFSWIKHIFPSLLTVNKFGMISATAFYYNEKYNICTMWGDFLWLAFLTHSSKLLGKLKQSMFLSAKASDAMACNGNGLPYCILFMIPIDHFPSALRNVIYPQRFRHPFSWAVFFNICNTFSQLQNRSLKFYSSCQRGTFLQWSVCVDRREITWFRYFMSLPVI